MQLLNKKVEHQKAEQDVALEEARLLVKTDPELRRKMAESRLLTREAKNAAVVDVTVGSHIRQSIAGRFTIADPDVHQSVNQTLCAHSPKRLFKLTPSPA